MRRTYKNITQDEWTKKLDEEGFSSIEIVTVMPKGTPGPHTHDTETVHVILQGELTITDENGETTYREGDRLDFPAGTTHTATFGKAGCSMIVATK
jgi:quercetin dioxygenase-like cupin family protein